MDRSHPVWWKVVFLFAAILDACLISFLMTIVRGFAIQWPHKNFFSYFSMENLQMMSKYWNNLSDDSIIILFFFLAPSSFSQTEIEIRKYETFVDIFKRKSTSYWHNQSTKKNIFFSLWYVMDLIHLLHSYIHNRRMLKSTWIFFAEWLVCCGFWSVGKQNKQNEKKNPKIAAFVLT